MQQETAHARMIRYVVPPEEIQYYPESEKQRSARELLERVCLPVTPPDKLSPECLTALSDYFMDEPIWRYSWLYNYSGSTGFDRARSRINPRASNLPYGYDDYAMDNVPLWRDILDGRLEERKFEVKQTVADPACNELARFGSEGGIERHMAARCAAREMYKYATYLDACVTAMDRVRLLESPTGDRNHSEMNGFQMSLAMIEQHITNESDRNLATRRLEKGYLHSKWIIDQCAGNIDGVSSWIGSNENELFLKAWPAHNYALRIAARTGDEWAIRSYPLKIGDGDQFKRELMDQYPLLMHRYLGNSRLLHSSVDRRRHQAKAYVLLEKLAGTEVAKGEIDIEDLQEELAYVQGGGELAMPQSAQEQFKESLEIQKAMSEGNEINQEFLDELKNITN